MTPRFFRPALICNRQSGSYDASLFAAIDDACRAQGIPLITIFALPDDDVPDAALLTAQQIDLLLVWTGDGTINAAARRAAGWDGAILPLPGGTLNLLSKALHGDRPAPDILTDVLDGKGRRRPIPTLRSEAGEAFITVVAGPATRWAEVRETMRQDGLIEASRDAPDAFDDMLNAPGVRVGADGADYQAVILTPTADGIRANGIITDGTADVLRHGLAWLNGDFRDGPSERIATAPTIELNSRAPISIEYDGELGEVAAPLVFTAETSAVDFVATA